MIDIALFTVTALVLTVTPGPAVIYIVTRSLGQGRSAGLVSCLGLALGGMVHALAAAFGLSTVLATSALAFSVVKYAGAAYLVWLGVRKLSGKAEAGPQGAPEARSLSRVFRQAVVVNVLNPKAALFFLAFLPQFVVPSRGDLAFQFALLGALFILIAFCTDVAWALAASGAGAWLSRHPGYVRAERYLTGSVYLGLGLAAAFSGDARK